MSDRLSRGAEIKSRPLEAPLTDDMSFRGPRAPGLTTTEQLIILQDDQPSTRREAEVIIRGAGGKVLQAYSNRVLLADIPLPARAYVQERMTPARSLDEPAPSAAPLAQTEQLAVRAWNIRRSPQYVEAKLARPMAERTWGAAPPDRPDGGYAEVEESEEDDEDIRRAPPPDLSPYLIGSVAVGLIIVQGTLPALQFTEDEQAKVVAEVQEGHSWLAAQEPLANVSWELDPHVLTVGALPDPTLPLRYEPMEALWRDPALALLGFPSGAAGVEAYVAALRSRLNCDWGYVAFFTKYPIKHFAYAAKPRLVMHYNNGDWGPDNIAEVFTHETGHIFGCPDEYRESGCTCTERFGFLQEPNANCESCATNGIACLMARNTRQLCPSTRIHLGWRDSNGDGILDPLDSRGGLIADATG